MLPCFPFQMVPQGNRLKPWHWLLKHHFKHYINKYINWKAKDNKIVLQGLEGHQIDESNPMSWVESRTSEEGGETPRITPKVPKLLWRPTSFLVSRVGRDLWDARSVRCAWNSAGATPGPPSRARVSRITRNTKIMKSLVGIEYSRYTKDAEFNSVFYNFNHNWEW